MKCQNPALLKPGDQVALIAPSSPFPNPADLEPAVASTEALGLVVKRYPTLTLREDYMAGTPEQRAKDLRKAFLDPKVKGIFCIRGGYSAGHLMPMLDWKELGATGKLFCGFSDLTTVLTALAAVGKLAGLHGPTMGFLGKPGEEAAASREGLKKFLFSPWKGISYRELCGKYWKPLTIRRGVAEGRLIGGNAAVFAGLIGTPVIPKKGPFILFLEDVGEKPYRLDRYVTQIFQSDLRDQITGVVLGQFSDCDPGSPEKHDALTVLARLLAPLKIPVMANVPIGHEHPTYSFPMGAKATMDAGKGELVLL